MKRFLSLTLCLMIMASVCAVPATAATEMLPYHTFLDGADLADGMTINYECFAQATRGYPISSHTLNAEKDCMTITPTLGKSAMEFSVALGREIDLKSIYSDGFLRLKTKSRAIPSKVWITVKKGSPNGGQWPFNIGGWLAETDSSDNWYITDLPISGFIKQAVHNTHNDVIDKIYILFEYADGITPAPVDFSEIAIYGPDIRPKATVLNSGMNKAGKYEVKLQFDRDIKPETFASGVFKIGNVAAESAVYDSFYAQATLVFDMMPDFPSELTIDITGDMVGKNGYSVYPTVSVSNKGIPETAALLDGYTCTLANNAIDFDGQVSCIYDKTGAGQTVTVFVAVFKGNTLIDAKASETKTLTYKSLDTFSVDIPNTDLTEVAAGTEVRAEIYLIDSEASGRPLAKVASVVLQ